jgi:hypothetical protein
VQARHLPHGFEVMPVSQLMRLGEDARERRLADAARAGEEVRVVQALRIERVDERGHDVRLADDLLEDPGRHLRARTW